MAKVPQNNQELNERQKAIVRLATYDSELRDNWKMIYLLASCDDWKRETSLTNFRQNVSKFKNSEPVYRYYHEELRRREDEKNELLNQANFKNDSTQDPENENVNGNQETKPVSRYFVNFERKEELVKWLNRELNKQGQTSDKLTMIKTMIDLLQFKQESPNKSLQRFYTPLNCQGCAIYQKAKEQSENEKEGTI